MELSDLARSTLLLTERELAQSASVTKTLEHAPVERGSRSKLHQVVLNLVVNAKHAVESRALPPGDRHVIRLATRLEGNDSILEVSDTGCGVAPEHLPHLFEPFFTTKPVGVGTGLGLSVCSTIVQRLGGRIEVEEHGRRRLDLPSRAPLPSQRARRGGAAVVRGRLRPPPQRFARQIPSNPASMLMNPPLWLSSLMFALPAGVAVAQEREAGAAIVEPVSVDEVLPEAAGEASGRVSVGAQLPRAGEGGASVLPRVQVFVGLSERVGAEAGLGAEVRPLAGIARVSTAAVGLKVALARPDGAWPGLVAKVETRLDAEEGVQVAAGLGVVGRVGRLTAQGTIALALSWAGAAPELEANAALGWALTEHVYVLVEAEAGAALGPGGTPRGSVGPAVKWVSKQGFFLALGTLIGVGAGLGDVAAVLQGQLER